MANYKLTVSQPGKVDAVLYLQTTQVEINTLVFLLSVGNTTKLDGYDLPLYSSVVYEVVDVFPGDVVLRQNKTVTVTYWFGEGATFQTSQVIVQFQNLLVEAGGAQRLVNLANQNAEADAISQGAAT